MHLYWLDSRPYNWNELLELFGVNEQTDYLVNFFPKTLEKAILETNETSLIWLNFSIRQYGENKNINKVFVTTGIQTNLEKLEERFSNISSIIDTCNFEYERLFAIFKDMELQYIYKIEIDKVRMPF